MSKQKLTAAEKAAKARRKREFETMFIRGRMKRVRRPETIEGMEPEFILRNADPIWLHQNGMWEYIQDEPVSSDPPDSCAARSSETSLKRRS